MLERDDRGRLRVFDLPDERASFIEWIGQDDHRPSTQRTIVANNRLRDVWQNENNPLTGLYPGME